MQDVSDAVEEGIRATEKGPSDEEKYMEKGSFAEFLGRTTSEDVEREWKALGLDKQSS